MSLKGLETAIAEELPKAIGDLPEQAAAGAADLSALCLTYLVRGGIAEKADVIRHLRQMEDHEENQPLERAMMSRVRAQIDSL